MTEYDSLDELWLEAAELVLDSGEEMPSRDGDTRELTGFVARLTNPACNFMFNPLRRMSPSYAAAELLWYLSGEIRIDRILPYAPQYSRFADRLPVRLDGEGNETEDPMHPRVISSCAPGAAYGWRFQRKTRDGLTQIDSIIHLLRDQPDSRQAVLGIWDPGYDIEHAINKSLKTIPCTLAVQFLIRDGKLNASSFMRSNDLWLGLPNDIFCFTSLQCLIAESLDIPVGWYQHHATSLHCYDRDIERATKAASPPSFKIPTGDDRWGPLHGKHPAYIAETIAKAVKLEKWNREKKVLARMVSDLGEHSMLHDIVCMAASRWYPRAASSISDKHLRKYTETFNETSSDQGS